MWDADTGKELLTFRGVIFAAFSPDGHQLLTGDPLNGSSVLIHDDRPVNRAFITLPVAPPPRAMKR